MKIKLKKPMVFHQPKWNPDGTKQPKLPKPPKRQGKDGSDLADDEFESDEVHVQLAAGSDARGGYNISLRLCPLGTSPAGTPRLLQEGARTFSWSSRIGKRKKADDTVEALMAAIQDLAEDVMGD